MYRYKGGEFNPQQFSSRKLLDVASHPTEYFVAPSRVTGRLAAIDELARRGHYLTELTQQGLIESHPNR